MNENREIYLIFAKKWESPFRYETKRTWMYHYFRMWIGVPSTTSAASIVISPNVG